MVTLNDIREAQARLSGVAVRTGLIETSLGEYAAGPDARKLYLKPENLNPSAPSSCVARTTKSRRFRQNIAAAA